MNTINTYSRICAAAPRGNFMQDHEFEVYSVEEMRRRFYLKGETPPRLQLNPQVVPVALQSLIPLAEEWGVSDDILRMDMVKARPNEIEHLRKTLVNFEDALDAWLAGPEAQSSHFSAEYLAFSNMRMAADGC